MTTNTSKSSSPPPSSPFVHILPPTRLGRSHKTLQSFSLASYELTAQVPQHRQRIKSKHYSLVVVTESRRRRILLGLKHRGFGVGFYNSFGGKLELSECATTCAVRELEEETGIKVPYEVMKRREVGLLRFTFEDDDEGEMIVYLFRLDVTCDPTETKLAVANASDNGDGNGVVVAMDDGGTVLDEKSKKLEDGPYPIDPTVIRGCEEITPYWYDDWFTIPLHQMFADDSVWLTKLLLSSAEVDGVKLNGHFHFCEGGQEVNTVMHHYVDFSTNLGNRKEMTMPMELNDDSGEKAEPIGKVSSEETQSCSTGMEQAENHCPEGLGGNETRSSEHETSSIPTAQASSPLHLSPKSATYTLEQRLFHAIQVTPNHSPSIKEFKECYAFLNAVRTQFARNSFDVVLDVAGGHGALAALFLITTSATEAVVIDPAVVGGGGVENAWKDYWKGKTLRYRHECLRTGLPDVLTRFTTSHNKTNRVDDDSEKKTVAAAVVDKSRILVVACHACQHLSDEILHISSSYGVHVAVMPCCQRDTSPGTSWKSASKNMNLPIGPLLDVQLAGKMMNWTTGQTAGVRYDVRMKVIDSKITPQNRIIVCKALNVKDDENGDYGKEVEMAHRRLESAYRRAHLNGKDETNKMVDRSRSVCHDPTSCSGREKWTFFGSICIRSMAVGLGVGLSLSFLFRTRR